MGGYIINKKFFIIGIVILFIFPNTYAILQESFNSNQANGNRIGGTTYWSQVFTPSTTFNLTSIKIKIGRRAGSPGNVVVGLYAVNSSDFPIGSALASGSFAASTVTTSSDYANFPYYEATMGSNPTLFEGVKYGITVNVDSGSFSTDYIYWNGNYTTGLYANGISALSSDSGSTWTAYADRDFGFEVYGDTDTSTLSQELISYWKFDGDATDSVASNDGTVTSASQTTGIINQGYSFSDSVTDHVVMNYAAFKYTASDTFTIQIWYKYTADGYFFGSVKNTGAYSKEYLFLSYCSAGSCFTGIEGGTGSSSINTNLGSIDDGNLHHIVYVFDGANSHANSNIYVDGVAKNPDFSGITGDLNKNGNYGKIVFGSIEESYTSFDFSGIIDEPAIWNRALSSIEVSQLYNSGNGFQYPFSIGWTGTFLGILNPSSILGVDVSNIYSVMGVI